MQYEKRTENSPLSSTVTSRTVVIDDYKPNSEIRRKRIILLILLAVQLVFALFYFLESLIGSVIQKYGIKTYQAAAPVYYRSTTDPLNFLNNPTYFPTTTAETYYSSSSGLYSGSLIVALISLVYITIFIIVVAEYVHLGIRILAWLGLIQLICTAIIIIITIIAIVRSSAAVGAIAAGIGAGVIVIILSGISCILTILTVVYAFKLANEIKQHQHYQKF